MQVATHLLLFSRSVQGPHSLSEVVKLVRRGEEEREILSVADIRILSRQTDRQNHKHCISNRLTWLLAVMTLGLVASVSSETFPRAVLPFLIKVFPSNRKGEPSSGEISKMV